MKLVKVVSLLLLVFSSGLFITCEEEPPVAVREYPVVDTQKVTNISENGAQFNAVVLQSGTSEVLDYGFVYTYLGSPTIENSDFVSLGSKIPAGSFSAVAENNLEKDKVYSVRTYIVIKQPKLVVYGQTVEFKSQGGRSPRVMAFEPASGVVSDTVLITGKGFSNIPLNNTVTFGASSTKVLRAKLDSLWVLVPPGATVGNNRLAVKVGPLTGSSSSNFILRAATIDAVEPTLVSFGDTILVTGTNFPRYNESIVVKLLGRTAYVIAAFPDKFKAVVSPESSVAESNAEVTIGTQKLVSGKTVLLKQPRIDKFLPAEGKKDSVLTIMGEYFSPILVNNKVEFNTTNAQVISVARKEIKVKVPDLVPGAYNVSVTTVGQKVVSEFKFRVKGPVITSITPASVTWNELVSINGSGFSSVKTDNMVKVNGTVCVVESATESLLTFRVPVNLLKVFNIVSVKVPTLSQYEVSFPTPLKLRDPVITGFFPAQGKSGDIITIQGKDMYPAVENQVITFGGYPVEVLEGTATTVKVKLLSGFPASNVTARIDLGELLSVSSQTFELISPWRQLKDFPVANLIRGYSFVLNGVAYVGGIVNGLQYFYRYNQGNDSWISETPTSAAGFYPNNFTVVNNGSIALVGLPQDPGAKPFSNDFYEYDAATKQWISAGKFPNETPYTGATGFAFANAGYVTNGLIRTGYIPGFGYAYYRLNTTYKFDFATRVWTEVERSPNVAQDGSFVAARSEAASFTIGDNAYIFGGIGDREPLSDMIIFNNVSNSWSHRTTTLPARGYASGFSIGQFGFLVGGSGYGGRLNDCWKFNPNTGEWTQVGNFPGPPRYDAISFVLNGKAYFGLGNGASSDLKDFWEFDPSKL